MSEIGKKDLSQLGLDLIEEIERSWNLNKLYIVTLIADLISTIVITYFTFLIYKLPQEYFWTVLAISAKPYFTTSFFLVSKIQKAKLVNIITKVMDEAIKIRDMAEWQVELAACKPDSLDRIKKALMNVTLWNTSNEKIALMEKINELEMKINILEQKEVKAI